MKNFKLEGIIIKRQNFGEADRFVTLFTRRFGKMRVLAKGVRRIQSRRGPNVELFNRGTFSIHKGRTFDVLTEVEVDDTHKRIKKNLELIGLAYYVCELIDGLCAEDQPHPSVFDLLVKTLNELDRGVLERFETTLLVELGFLPASPAGGPRNRILPIDTTSYIEQLLERKLKSKKILPKLTEMA